MTVVPSFDRNQLCRLLSTHDVGLFTSRVEGWGLVLNEMLESGMTVFATNSGGVPDLKPFFKEALSPFPPKSNFVLADLAFCSEMERYYNMFSWEAIAEEYMRNVSKSI